MGKKRCRRRTFAPTISEVGQLITSRMLSKAFASEPKGSNGKRKRGSGRRKDDAIYFFVVGRYQRNVQKVVA